jgi:hypothetical protein
MKSRLKLLALFLSFQTLVFSQSSKKILSDRPFPDFTFHAGLGYLFKNNGYNSRFQLDYFLKERFSMGAAINFINEEFRSGPQSFKNCGLLEGEGRPHRTFIFLSFPTSYHLLSENKRQRGTFSLGPAIGLHTYPKEFIEKKHSGFLIPSSTCIEIINANKIFIGLDAQLKADVLIGKRTGVFIGYNLLIAPDNQIKGIIQAGYQMTLS